MAQGMPKRTTLKVGISNLFFRRLKHFNNPTYVFALLYKIKNQTKRRSQSQKK